jgi:hypothetical protein
VVAKREDELIREVMAEMAKAFEVARRRERLETVAILLLFVVGLGLLVFGAVTQAWQLLVPGGLVQASIVVPLQRLVKLRAEQLTLQLLPQLMRLADSQEAKELAARLVKKLIGRL